MRKADRLFKIIDVLRTQSLATARELADRFEVSERTIYRDVQHLVLSGVPIDGEAGVGYMLRGFELPPLTCSPRANRFQSAAPACLGSTSRRRYGRKQPGDRWRRASPSSAAHSGGVGGEFSQS